MTQKEHNFFIRYLKENGLFSDFCYEIRNQPYRRRNEPYLAEIKRLSTSNRIILALIGWADSRLGNHHWGDIFRAYSDYYLKNYLNKND